MIVVALAIAAATAEPVPLPDHPLAVSFRDYPIAALKVGSEGVATVRFSVGTDGVPRQCRVIVSSHDTSLDDASCMVINRTRFRPALDNRHHPLVVSVDKRIQWRIEWGYRPAAWPFADRTITSRLSLDAAGHVADCKDLGLIEKERGECDAARADAGLEPFLARLLGRPLAGIGAIELQKRFVIHSGPDAPDLAPPPGVVFSTTLSRADFEVGPNGNIVSCHSLPVPVASPYEGVICRELSAATFVPDPSASQPRRVLVVLDVLAYAAASAATK